MTIIPIYKNRIISLPYEVLSDKITNATLDELKVLIAVLATPEFNVAEMASSLDVTENSFNRAINKWQDEGVIVIDKTGDYSKKKTKTVPSSSEKNVVNVSPVTKTKPLASTSLPGYTSDELAEILGGNNTHRQLIDSCQQILGRIFNYQETSIIVGLSQQLSLSNDYILLLCSYAATIDKKAIKYIERIAFEFYERDIVSYADLEKELNKVKERNSYESFIKSLYGTGSRKLTSKEQSQIHTWRDTYGFSNEMITKAYEQTISSINEPKISYTHSILENWYSSGVKDEKDLEKYNTKTKNEKSGTSSFDTDQFFEKVLNESYK